MATIDADTLYGTLSLLILKSLSDGPLHGLAISRQIHREADRVLRVDEGALYPALHRLERDGLVRGAWGVSDTRRRAKFYDLTPRGRRRLRQEIRRWVKHANAVAAVLELPAAWSERSDG